MALINTAGILAGRGFRVLVIDLDLEAPGLSYLNPNAPAVSPLESNSQRPPVQPGFVDLLNDARERGEEADMFQMSAQDLANRYTQPYHLPDELREFKDGSLHIMPAGRIDGGYAQRLDALKLHQLYEEGLGEPLIRAFKKKFAEADLYDYVLVDSRTGFSDEAGICTRDLADHLMILSGLNRQNVEGTCEFLKALRAETQGKPPTFQIILSPVPNGEDALLDEREKMAKKSFAAAWGSEVDLSLQIPYHPQLALTEEPHIFRRRRGYLFEAYRSIEKSLLHAIGHDARTLMRKIEERLKQREYPTVLRDLRHIVRLDEGRSALSQLASNLATKDRQSLRGKIETDATQENSMLENMLGTDDGRRVVEFVVDHIAVYGMGGWAGTLLRRLEERSIDLADRLFKRIAEAASNDVETLGSYAVFLEQQRGDMDGAERYYKQAIVADPKSAATLNRYANFLDRQRDDLDGAERHYKEAIETDPKRSATLGNYAIFLQHRRGDLDGAEVYFKRAFEAHPQNAINLCNYGQFLIGGGGLSDGETALLSSFDDLTKFGAANMAEACYSLWLVLVLQKHDARRWEQGFKYLLQKGFKRYPWNFDRMLEKAKKTLPPEEFEYAQALAQAFLDESKVADLEQFERWRDLVAVDPKSSQA